MADYQDYYNQYSTANSKNDENGSDGGGTTDGATETTLVEVRDRLPNSRFFRLMNADDLSTVTTYLDAETVNERINTITYSSASLSISLVDTYSYAGTAGSYRLTSTVRS